MTLQQYKALRDYWNEHGPPTFVTIAAAVGFKGRKPAGADAPPVQLSSIEDVEAFVRQFSKAG